ncbi:MAG TPA: HD domain-containing protein [Roseiflexaceae bacterium]
MSWPDFERARSYALERLERELSPMLFYHSLAHTRDEVAPATQRLAELTRVGGEALLLLRTAAYYHDIGFVERRDDHESIGARIAAAALPDFGYTPPQVDAIRGMIIATRLPQAPRTLLEQLLADADLDVLGREDFLARNQALREELAAEGIRSADAQWYADQLRFMRAHRYWTAAAQSARGALKLQNIARLAQLLAERQARERE